MAAANLRWTAQTSEAEAQILALKAVIDSIGSGSSGSGIRKTSSDVSKLGHDTETAGKKIERAFMDIPKTLDKFGKGLSGPFGILRPLGMVIQVGGKLGGVMESVGGWLGKLGGDGEMAAGSLLQMGSSMGPLLAAAGPVVAILIALGGALLFLPALAGLVAGALTALLDVMMTGVAVVAAFMAPLTVLTALLGGLGAAFAFVAKQSFANKASMQDQKDALLALHVAQQTYNTDLAKYGAGATQTEKALLALHAAQDKYAAAQRGVAVGSANLDDKFQKLVATLSKDFTPEIIKLADAASTALTYLDNVAKLPLDKAFSSLNTRGVQLLSQFVRGVGHAISEPIRLALKVAFTQDSGMRNAMQGWWDSARRYLFGYTSHQKVRIGDLIAWKDVPHAGVLTPVMKWLGNQHFEKTGLAWADSIINAVKKSHAWAGIKTFVETVASDAGSKAGSAFEAAFVGELQAIPGAIWDAIWGSGNAAGNANAGADLRAGTTGARGGARPTHHPLSGGGGRNGGGGLHGGPGKGHVMTVLVPDHEVRRLMRTMNGHAARLA
jgi:hypothetical protein